MAKVDGNRTRRTGITHPTRFEGGEFVLDLERYRQVDSKIVAVSYGLSDDRADEFVA